MKLFNRTKLADSVLDPLLVAAGRCAGAKTSGVVVQVTRSQQWVHGVARMAPLVRLTVGGRYIRTSGGWFRIALPCDTSRDSLFVAEQFFRIAIHEWKHIADYQAGGRFTMAFASRGSGGRRPRHDSRPEELRAINCVDEAISGGALQRYEDLIINLAVSHDELRVPVRFSS